MKRTCIHAGGAMAALGFVAWGYTFDPGWTRRAGLDIWNAPRLEAAVRDHEAVSRKLDDGFDRIWHRTRVNDGLTRDVADGRLSLAAGAALVWEVNRDVPGFVFSLDLRFKCPTPMVGCARLLLMRVAWYEDLPASSRALALDRLRAEYADEYGHPAPRDSGRPFDVASAGGGNTRAGFQPRAR